jgi:hypothetical protein
MEENTVATEQPQVESVQSTESSQPVENESVSGTESAPEEAYQPTYKFKSLGEEREFDDWMKGAIKSQEHEKAARELYEKAYGLDHYKEKYSKKEESYKQLASDHEKVTQFLDQITFLRDNAPDKFFEVMGMNPIDYLQKKLSYEQMSPEQRAVYDENKIAKIEQYKRNQEIDTYKQVYMQQVATNMNMTLDTLLSQPKYQQVTTMIPDFREQVLEYGKSRYSPEKGDIAPQEAIEAVYNRYAKFIASNGAAPLVNVATPDSKPVIPKVKGSSGPVSKQIQSVDDIKKLYNKKFGTGVN